MAGRLWKQSVLHARYEGHCGYMLIRMRRYRHICLVLAIAAVMMLYAWGYRDGGPAGTGAFVHDAGGTVAVITGDNADTAGPADIGDIAADTADTTDNVPGSAATAAGDTPGASGDPAVGVINNSADTDDNDTAVVDSAARE